MQGIILLKMKRNLELKSVEPKNTPPISQFLRLPQRIMNAPRILHEPLVDYSKSQLLTSDDHIHSMQEIATKKNLVAKQKKEKLKQMELIKAKRVAEKSLKDATKK